MIPQDPELQFRLERRVEAEGLKRSFPSTRPGAILLWSPSPGFGPRAAGRLVLSGKSSGRTSLRWGGLCFLIFEHEFDEQFWSKPCYIRIAAQALPSIAVLPPPSGLLFPTGAGDPLAASVGNNPTVAAAPGGGGQAQRFALRLVCVEGVAVGDHSGGG
eukprot:CAMPEP_0206528038 /NCGR_PEP_ID=MMETSP0325_2-20121206/1716_1 /ASSEMBLY_ACC=CAM_ASM_000347 /TAXON_ID=2866 /ORGANISM="Crypthecodinium cohnii, Strain Seligo" /LENGTH=158 /DNA_ID=CAMNT_0054023583 /DNA_START=260 /DNA_END=733 /DNA_ORIENTATION=-